MVHVVAFFVYIWDIDTPHVWSRYIAGLIESIRTLPYVFPKFKAHVTLGKDTLELLTSQGHTKWSEKLEEALASEHVYHVVYVDIDRKVPKRIKRACMLPLIQRYNCIGSMSNEVRSVAFRDADSPLTPADYMAVQGCITRGYRGVLLYNLPIYGTKVCGGCITLLHLEDFRESLFTWLEKHKYDASRKNAWGVDELRIEWALKQACLATFEMECFHCAHCASYHTTQNMDVPIVDRLWDECDESCHWNLINKPSRYETKDGVEHPCDCSMKGRHVPVLPNLISDSSYRVMFNKDRVFVGVYNPKRSFNCGCHVKHMGISIDARVRQPQFP